MSTTMTPPAASDPTTLIPKKLVRARPLFDPEIVSLIQQTPVALAVSKSFGLRGYCVLIAGAKRLSTNPRSAFADCTIQNADRNIIHGNGI